MSLILAKLANIFEIEVFELIKALKKPKDWRKEVK